MRRHSQPACIRHAVGHHAWMTPCEPEQVVVAVTISSVGDEPISRMRRHSQPACIRQPARPLLRAACCELKLTAGCARGLLSDLSLSHIPRSLSLSLHRGRPPYHVTRRLTFGVRGLPPYLRVVLQLQLRGVSFANQQFLQEADASCLWFST